MTEANEDQRDRETAEERRAAPHVPVLMDELLDLLNLEEGATAVDCTAGAGGHLQALVDTVGESVGVQADGTEPRHDIGHGELGEVTETPNAQSIEQRDEIDRYLPDLREPGHGQVGDAIGGRLRGHHLGPTGQHRSEGGQRGERSTISDPDTGCRPTSGPDRPEIAREALEQCLLTSEEPRRPAGRQPDVPGVDQFDTGGVRREYLEHRLEGREFDRRIAFGDEEIRAGPQRRAAPLADGDSMG